MVRVQMALTLLPAARAAVAAAHLSQRGQAWELQAIRQAPHRHKAITAGIAMLPKMQVAVAADLLL